MKESFVFSEFIRRLNNIVRLGTVSEVDYKKARIRVKIGKITTTWIPCLTTAGAIKLCNPPVVGEQVSVISHGGDLSLAVAIPSIFQSKFDAPSNDENVVRLELLENANIEFDKGNDDILIKTGDSKVTLNNDKIRFSVGASEIEKTSKKISIHAPIIDAPSFKVGI
jgi:phage baseplate assembly protein V